jgi:hypothetical protein
MISVSLDIFRKDAQGNPIWIGTTQDMDDARDRTDWPWRFPENISYSISESAKSSPA